MKKLFYIIFLLVSNQLNGLADLIGTVTDINTGSPISRAVVKLTRGNLTRRRDRTNPDGFYSIRNIIPNYYIVIVSASGYQTKLVGVRLRDDRNKRVNFQLSPFPGRISGTVRNASTLLPISDATLTIFQDNIFITRKRTNINGDYVVRNLAPGNYVVLARADNFESRIKGTFVQSNQTSQVNFLLNPNPGRIIGNIRDSSTSNPIRRALIEVFDGPIKVGFAYSDLLGNYTIPNLAPGNYSVVASADNFQLKVLGAIVFSNATTIVNFNLTPNPGSISGKVTNANTGRAISGATILVIQNFNIISSTLTNQNGRYIISGLEPGNYIVVAKTNNFGASSIGAIVTSNNTTIANLELFPLPGKISGKITDTSSNPIEGAIVQIFDNLTLIATAVTDSDGNYQAPNLAAGNYTVLAIATNFQSQAKGAIVVSNQTTTVNFALLSNPGTISGTIRNSSTSNPIAGALVEVFDGATKIGFANSDVNGNYTISSLAPGNYNIIASANNFQSQILGTTVFSNTTTIVNFNLNPNPGSIAGKVTNANTGASISGASILVIQNFNIVASTLTDQNGNYLISGLTPGNYTVVAKANNFGTSAIGAIVTSNNTTTANLELSPRPGKISGKVTDTSANPIGGATVQIFDNLTLITTAITDSDGNYQAPNLAAGNYTVLAIATNFQSQAKGAIVVSNQTTTVNFALLSNPGTISGTIRNSSTSNPIAGALVEVFDGPTKIGFANSDLNGNYTISSLAPGNYNVIASSQNFQSQILGATVFSNTTTIVNFNLNPNPGSIAGKVTNANTGVSISGASILVVQNSNIISSTLTDQNGNYLISGLTPGNYTVVAKANNFGTSAIGAIVTSNNTTTANLELSPRPGTISGKVTDTSANPIGGATVQIFDNLTLITTAITDSDGNYQAPNLTAGNYTVLVRATNFQSQAKGAIVVSNQTTTVNFSLSPNPGTISGTIRNSSNSNPIAGALVEIFDGPTKVGFANSDLNGNYTISSLAPGNYNVIANADDFQSQILGATVFSNTTTIVNFNLNPNPGSIAGKVTNSNTGASISGASILVIQNFNIVASTLTDQNGRYIIPGLESGNYIVIANATNFESSALGANVISNETAIANFELSPRPGKISGKVTDTSANPIESATIQIFDELVLIATAITDSVGNYQVPNLAPGNYTVLCNANNFASQSKNANVQANKTTIINFSLNNIFGSIAGKVTNTLNNPLSGALVVAFKNTTMINYALTDSNGDYTITNLEPGNYFVVAIAKDHQSAFFLTTVNQGSTTIVNFQLNANPGEIKGKITQKQCPQNPVGGVLVTALDSGVVVGFDLSNQNGKYSILNLAPGQYTVTTHKKDFLNNEKVTQVISNQTTILNFVIENTISPTPEPPENISGQLSCNQYLTQTNFIHEISWTKSPSQCLIGYFVFRNGIKIAFIPASANLKFIDCDFIKKAVTYAVRTVNTFGKESSPATITFN